MIISPFELECLEVKEFDESTHSILAKVSSEISGSINRCSRASMIRFIPRENLMFSSESSSSSDGNLVGIRSGQREDEACDILRSHIAEDLGEFSLRLGDCETTIHMMKGLQLFGNGISDRLWAPVTKVVVNCLRRHAEVFLAVVVVEVHTLATLDGEGTVSCGISWSPCVHHMLFCALHYLVELPIFRSVLH